MWYSFRFFLYLFLLVCLVIIVIEWSSRNERKYTKIQVQEYKELLNRTQEAANLSGQDGNEVQAFAHAIEANTLLQALKQLVPPEHFSKILGCNSARLTEDIQQRRYHATERLVGALQACKLSQSTQNQGTSLK